MKRYICLLILLAVFILSAFFNEAYAEPICIAITAEVTYVNDEMGVLDGAINVGDVITGVYVYESTTPDTSSFPTVGIYMHTAAPFGITLSAGGLIFRTDPNNVAFLIGISNDHGSPAKDGYTFASYLNNFDIGSNSDNQIHWQLDDWTATAIASTALPTLPPDVADWESPYGLEIKSGWNTYPPSDYFHIRSLVTSATLCDETSQKFAICHRPGTSAERTLYLPSRTILPLLGHGDILGECSD